MRQAPILVVAGPALAHLTRVLAVAEILRDQGHQIVLATDQTNRTWLPIATQRGYPVELLPPVLNATTFAAGSLAAAPHAVHTAVVADSDLLRRVRPALVLVDWRPSMRLAAALHGTPLVAIVNAYVTRAYQGALSAPAAHPLTQRLGQRRTDRLMPLLAPLFFRQWATPYRQVARTYGLPGWRDLRDYACGDTTLYPDLPVLNPMAPHPPGVFVGPLTQYRLPVDPLPPLRDPVLYITLGSDILTDGAPDLVAAVGAWPGSVVITRAGSRTPWPAHWVCVEYADPVPLCAQHRVAWLVHGGNGTCYQLLQQWVAQPTHMAGALVLPFYVEHTWNATKLQALGVVRHMCPIRALRRDPAIPALLQQLHTAVAPAPSEDLINEVLHYRNAPERVARAVRAWL